MGPKFVALCSVAVGAVYAAGYIVTDKPIQTLAATTSPQASTSSQNGPSQTVNPNKGSSSQQIPPQGDSEGFHRHHRHDDGEFRHGDGEGDGHFGDGEGEGEGGFGSSNGQFGGSGGTGTFGGSGGATSGSANGSSGSSGGNSSGGSTTQGSNASGGNQSTKSAPATQKYIDGTYSGSGSNRIGMVSVAVTIHNGKISDVQITQCYTHYSESYINPVLPQEVMSTQNPSVGNISGATLSTQDFETAVYQALSQAQNPNYKG